MKILMVNKFFPPHVGGVETVTKQYAEFLSELGYDVEVLTFGDKNTKNRIMFHDGWYHLITCKPMLQISKLPVGIKFIFLFYRMAHSADIVIGHYPFPLFDLLSTFLFKKKIILVWHSEIVRQKRLKRLLHPFTKFLLNKSDVIYTTNSLRNDSRLSRHARQTHIVPLTLNVDDYSISLSKNNELSELLGVDYILFFGRLTKYKNVEWFLRFAERESQSGLRFIVCGDGEDAPLVEEYVKRFSNLIWIRRFLSHEEKTWIFKHARLYVFCSNRENEAFGITQLESLIMGTPVLNVDINSGVPEITKDLQICFTCKNDINSFLDGLAIRAVQTNTCIEKDLLRKHVLDNYEDAVAKDLLESIIIAMLE